MSFTFRLLPARLRCFLFAGQVDGIHHCGNSIGTITIILTTIITAASIFCVIEPPPRYVLPIPPPLRPTITTTGAASDASAASTVFTSFAERATAPSGEAAPFAHGELSQAQT